MRYIGLIAGLIFALVVGMVLGTLTSTRAPVGTLSINVPSRMDVNRVALAIQEANDMCLEVHTLDHEDGSRSYLLRECADPVGDCPSDRNLVVGRCYDTFMGYIHAEGNMHRAMGRAYDALGRLQDM